tara:strand:+ start:193 stop:456 length:264 start_codon:yes stop_codon:yes gene_type:complete
MYDFDNDPKRIQDKLYCSMSAHFLTQELPVEAIDWDEDKIEKWCEENVWEPFEYWDASDVMDLIESAAWHAYRFMKSNWKELSNDKV